MYNLYNWFHEAFSANLAPCLLSYRDSLQVVFKATWINHKPTHKIQDLKAEGVTAQVERFQKMERAVSVWTAIIPTGRSLFKKIQVIRCTLW